MTYYTKIDTAQMQVIIEENGKKIFQTEYRAGEMILPFIEYDAKYISEIMEMLFSLYFDYDDEGVQTMLERLLSENLFLHFFGAVMIDSLSKKGVGRVGDDPAPRDLLPNYSHNSLIDKWFENVNFAIEQPSFSVGIFCGHIYGVQQYIKSQLKFCATAANESYFTQLNPTQRLFLYEKWRDASDANVLKYDSNVFTTRMIMQSKLELPKTDSLEDLAKLLFAEDSDLIEMAVLEDGYSLIRYELMKMVMYAVPVRLCENCKRYFIAENHSTSLYCTRPLRDRPNKTCREVGAQIKEAEKVASDPILSEYKKAYKRQHSRVQNKKMDQNEFNTWSTEARELRDSCLAGEISAEEFFDWLNSDRIYKKKAE